MTISLREARLNGRLSEFADQEAKRGIGPISLDKFGQDAETIIKAPRLPDQTSDSRARDSSSGKKTR